MDKKVKVVVATMYNSNDFWEKAEIAESLHLHSSIGNIDSYEVLYENNKGLPSVYNPFIADEYKDYIVIFVHDDVVLDDVRLKEKVNEAIKTYDIVGVAGSSSMASNSPVTWFNGPRHCWSGSVTHPVHNKDNGAELRTTDFGVMPKKCVVVDGVFIAVNVENLLNSQVFFDEEFDFHFYDITLCLRAVEKKLTVGTWYIPITHMSHGGYASDSWKQSEKKFKEKYIKGE